MKLLIAVTAPNWAASARARLEQGRRAQMADVLRLVADRLQQGQDEGTFTRPEFEAVFRIEQSPADETADAA